MKVYCYPKCTTCKKALAWLDAKGVDYELYDIKEQHPSYEDLAVWYQMSGLPLRLLGADGMLVKRPLVIGDDFVLTGFKEAEWEKRCCI